MDGEHKRDDHIHGIHGDHIHGEHNDHGGRMMAQLNAWYAGVHGRRSVLEDDVHNWSNHGVHKGIHGIHGVHDIHDVRDILAQLRH